MDQHPNGRVHIPDDCRGRSPRPDSAIARSPRPADHPMSRSLHLDAISGVTSRLENLTGRPLRPTPGPRPHRHDSTGGQGHAQTGPEATPSGRSQNSPETQPVRVNLPDESTEGGVARSDVARLWEEPLSSLTLRSREPLYSRMNFSTIPRKAVSKKTW